MSLEEAVNQSYLTQGMSPQELQELYSLAEWQKFSDRDVILRQFDDTKDLFILASGQAHIVSVIGEPIGVIKPGMPMGEISFLDDRPRSVSVIAEGPSEAVRFAAEPLRALLESNPPMTNRLLWNVSIVLCSRLRSANNNIAALMAIDESETSYLRR